MCGIFGWIGQLDGSQEIAEQMTRRLRHRGPDSQRFECWPQGVLGHTRLKILDLSEAGSQPMSVADGRIWSVFNGEIYNFRELREWLQTKGHVFRGSCDAEVIPHLYQEMGPEFVEKLRGMFAIAIFDRGCDELWLYRDRFGIKPLYFAPSRDRLAFSSEIGALREHPWIDFSPDPQAVADFLGLRYVPAPQTFYRGAYALEAGHWLKVSYREKVVRWDTGAFHSWGAPIDYGLSDEVIVTRLETLVERAVGRQLQSDVPLGAFLSGGIDSSLICVEAQRAMKRPLRTFTIHFADSEYDETGPAEEVARWIGSEHESLGMESVDTSWDGLMSLLRAPGQPFADISILASSAVCREGRKHVTVALSGDGGDEGFAGYYAYQALMRISRLQARPGVWWDAISLFSPLAAAVGLISPEVPPRIRRFRSADEVELVQGQFGALSEAEIASLCSFDVGEPVRRHFERKWTDVLPPSASRLERLLALATEVNIRLTLPNDFLMKVDAASMKESLEVRVPLLDEDLMDFALSIPLLGKVNRREGKLPLRALVARKLPETIAQRGKHGFGVPLDLWFGSAIKKRIRENLLDPGTPLRQVLNPGIYEPWIEAFTTDRSDSRLTRQGLHMRVFMLLGIHTFLEARGL